MNINSLFCEQDAGLVQAQFTKSPFRRLSNVTENNIDPRLLCQAIHVDRISGPPRLLISDSDGKSGYYAHSVETAARLRDELHEYGIHRLFVGPLPAPGSSDDPNERLQRYSEMIAGLRSAFGEGFEIVVDPAGLCMRRDLRWGISRNDGSIDVEATLGLVAQAAYEFGEAGADGIVAIGRLNCEVGVLKAAAAKSSRPMTVMSFSTNSETTSAYFETTRHDVSCSRTGQKILVGNGNEMVVRGIADFGEGSDVIVQKPVEAFHLLAMFKQIASGQMSVDTFVSQTPGVEKLLRDNPLLLPAFQRGAAALKSGGRLLKTGTYEVSGTYSVTRMLSRAYSEDLAWAMLDEILLNAASAAGGTLEIIITRNALWYLKTRQRIARKAGAPQAELVG